MQNCNQDPLLEKLMHFILGLADMLELVVEKLREFAAQLRHRVSNVAPLSVSEER